MNPHLKNECEAIDASLFSGDALEDAETSAKFKAYLDRWSRALLFVQGEKAPEVATTPHPQLLKTLQSERDGWKEEVDRLRGDRDTLRSQLELRLAHQRSELWYWQGDGTDHPESFANGMCIVISGEQLRDIVNNRSADKLHADVTRCRYPVDQRLNHKGHGWDTGRLDEVLQDFKDDTLRPA